MAGYRRKSNRQKKEIQALNTMLGTGLLGGGRSTRQYYKEIGYYTVGPGTNDIQFDLNYPVQDILISCPSLEMPVCQGDLNYFAVTLLERGFILHTRITTDSATITWVSIEGYRDHDHVLKPAF